jgi:hypothetical protein
MTFPELSSFWTQHNNNVYLINFQIKKKSKITIKMNQHKIRNSISINIQFK